MTVFGKYRGLYLPVKFFLSSYRALSDGRGGIRQLSEHLEQKNILISDWKITWIGTCTVLRSAIDLFQVDAKSCINDNLKKSIKLEWDEIKSNKQSHKIFWEFIRKERDNIIHEYHWMAYETWLKPDGTSRGPLSLMALMTNEDGARPILRMKSGTYEGHDSLELLKEGADWVEQRITNSIVRAGFDPDELRCALTFEQPAASKFSTLLSGDIS